MSDDLPAKNPVSPPVPSPTPSEPMQPANTPAPASPQSSEPTSLSPTQLALIPVAGGPPKPSILKRLVTLLKGIALVVGFFGGGVALMNSGLSLYGHLDQEHVIMTVTGPDIFDAPMAEEPLPADQNEQLMRITFRCTVVNTGNRSARVVDARFLFGSAEDETPIPWKGIEIPAGQTALCDFERRITVRDAYRQARGSSGTPMQLLLKTVSGTGKTRRSQLGLGSITFLGSKYNGWGFNPSVSRDLMPKDDADLGPYWSVHGF